MLKKLKILLATFVLISMFVLAIPSNTKAQGIIDYTSNDAYKLWSHKWYSEIDFFAWYKKVYDPSVPESEIFGERYTAAQVQWITYSIVSNFLNLIPTNPDLTICILKDLGNCAEVLNKAEEVLNPLVQSEDEKRIASLFSFSQSPVSGVAYVQRLISKFSPVKEVYAQGFGYNTAANSILSLWTITRNISYGFMVIAVIVLAFMIMFRVKINPQTMVTVQVAIPRVISALILITFSYAIAGFAIDLMYVVIGLIAMGLSGQGLSQMSVPDLFKDMTSRNAFGLMYSYWIHFVSSAFMAAFSGFGLGILVFLFAIVSILAIFFWSFKIIFMIIKNFAMLILTIITGPLEIMLGTVTQSSGFGPWFKKLLSYLAFYPVMIIMFFLAFFFLNQGGSTYFGMGTQTFSNEPFKPADHIISDNAWEPPLSFLTSSGYRLVWLLVSFVIFSEMTKVAEITQAFISGKQWAFGSGMNEIEKTYSPMVDNTIRLRTAGLGSKNGGAGKGGLTEAEAVRLPTSYVISKTIGGYWKDLWGRGQRQSNS